MTHILKADKEFFRLLDLKELANDSKYKGKNNIPVRVLASVYCFITREGMYKISQIAREEKLSQAITLKLDGQMENEFIFENDPLSEQLKLSMITRDGFYMFMDCSELHKDLKLKINRQCFFSGNIIIIEHDIACLKLTCVTPAESLDINLYQNVRAIMETFEKKKKPEDRNIPKHKEAMDVEYIGNDPSVGQTPKGKASLNQVVEIDTPSKGKPKQPEVVAL